MISAQPLFRRIASIGILLLGLGWIFLSRVEADQAEEGRLSAPQIGFFAPDFELSALDGQTVSLRDLRGRAVILNFWASWCAPCRAEMPALQAVAEDYRDAGLVVLAVNAAFQDRSEDVVAFVGQHDLTFSILLDENGRVNRLYQVRSLPTTFFIGRDGLIQEVVIGGPMSSASLRVRADSLTRETP
jgi:cytochrome c biogenesis protein CcmG/thiol:disulfide interchange protein DsbE